MRVARGGYAARSPTLLILHQCASSAQHASPSPGTHLQFVTEFDPMLQEPVYTNPPWPLNLESAHRQLRSPHSVRDGFECFRVTVILVLRVRSYYTCSTRRHRGFLVLREDTVASRTGISIRLSIMEGSKRCVMLHAHTLCCEHTHTLSAVSTHTHTLL